MQSGHSIRNSGHSSISFWLRSCHGHGPLRTSGGLTFDLPWNRHLPSSLFLPLVLPYQPGVRQGRVMVNLRPGGVIVENCPSVFFFSIARKQRRTAPLFFKHLIMRLFCTCCGNFRLMSRKVRSHVRSGEVKFWSWSLRHKKVTILCSFFRRI